MARTLLSLIAALALSGCLAFVPVDDDDSAVAGDDDDATADDDDSTLDGDADGDGVTADDGDCDDGDPDVHPGAPELCDGLDQDCDEEIDEGLDLLPFAPDHDGDGFPSSNGDLVVEACGAPDGYVPDQSPYDCADNLPDVHPDATEVCNGVDDDCDGTLDEGVLVDLYLDADQDGAGWGSTAVGTGCPGTGFSETNDDCDDDDPAQNQADIDGDGTTSCDGDCDDLDDSIVPGQDNDGDGKVACTEDCDDGDAAVFPGAPEVCNQRDDDCDGVADNGLGASLVIRGAAPSPGQEVWDLLDDAGYCVAPMMDVAAFSSSVVIDWYELIVVTMDTGDAAGWYGDSGPLSAWWNSAAAGGPPRVLLGMGLGGLAAFSELGVPSLSPTNSYTYNAGVLYANDTSYSLWTTPNQVLNSQNSVTVHTQSFAQTRGLPGVQGNAVRGTNTTGAPILIRTPSFSAANPVAWYWGFEQGLHLATTAGHELFENVVRDAIGPP